MKIEMGKSLNQSESTGNSEISEAGQLRRERMLSDLQDAMAQHHSRRHRKKRAFKFTTLVLVLISSSSWMIWQSLKSNNDVNDTTAKNGTTTVAPEIDKAEPLHSEKLDPKSINLSSSTHSMPPKKKTLVEKYVVSTANIETRQMETINDDEMLDLLKQAGVQGWIAEIGDERVVLDDDGKRL